MSDAEELRTCPVCGDEFEVYQSVLQKTCGDDGGCADILRSETLDGVNTGDGDSVVIECDMCGDEVKKWKSQYDKYDHHFCDRFCLAQWKIEEGLYEGGNGGLREHEELSHSTRSGWEEGVALLLTREGIEYEYESKTFDLGWKKYIPDFIVDDTVIEVKGQERDDNGTAESFMNEYPEYRYVVVGADIPADERIEYQNKKKLKVILNE